MSLPAPLPGLAPGLATAVPLADDPALPQRDLLLDPDVVGPHLARLLAVGAPLDVRGCRVVRVKYRMGESLRVVYRIGLPDGERTVSVRAFADRSQPARAARAAAGLVGDGRVAPFALDEAHGAAWWTFPADRRLEHVGRVLRPAGPVAELPGGRWERSIVMEYAPERSLTVQALGADGAVLGYAKAYRYAADVRRLVDLYGTVAGALAPHAAVVRTPSIVAVDHEHGIAVLEPMPGDRWDELDDAGAARLVPRLGRAVALLHGAPVPAGVEPFGRFAPERVAGSCALLAAARPDVAHRVERLAVRLAGGPPAEPAVLLHGDLHPKNALLDGDGLSLIDLDQAGTGAPSADLGSLLARLMYGELIGEHDAATAARYTGAALNAYGDERALPTPSALRWHVAAALVVERAVRAVNRVNAAGLRVLPDIVTAAERCLDREDLL